MVWNNCKRHKQIANVHHSFNVKNGCVYLVFASIFLLSACSYSFTGGAIPTEVRTISIEPFQNTASIVTPSLAQSFTEALRNKFITQTKLLLANNKGDWQMSGQITDYSVNPITVLQDQAAQNRLTLSVKIKFENSKDNSQNWEQSFSNFVDFSSSDNLSQNETALIQIVSEKLIQDIFNKTLSNW